MLKKFSNVKWLISPSKFDSIGLITFGKSKRFPQLNCLNLFQVSRRLNQKLAARLVEVHSPYWPHNAITPRKFNSFCLQATLSSFQRNIYLYPDRLFLDPWSNFKVQCCDKGFCGKCMHTVGRLHVIMDCVYLLHISMLALSVWAC